jgi:Pectate lyase superfamily protein
VASGITHFFDESRFLSAVGGLTGASVYFYYTETSNLAPVYTDKELTLPATNPVVIANGAILPVVFLDPTITYRRRIVFLDSSVRDVDPLYAPGVAVDDLLSADGAGLSGYSASTFYPAITVGSKLKDFVSIKDAPFGAKGNGVDDDTAAIVAAIAFMKARGGGTLYFPKGHYKTTATIAVDFDGLKIQGEGLGASFIDVFHNNIGISFVSPIENIPNGKFFINDLSIVNKQNYPLDGSGFPQATHQGTALQLDNCFGSSFQNLFIEGFDRSLNIIDSFCLEFICFTDRNCWTGRRFAGYSNYITFRGGNCNNSSIDTDRDEVKNIKFDNVDFEAASKTLVIGDGVRFADCRLERLHISRPWFRWLSVNGDNFLMDGNTRMFWDGSALPGSGEDDFFIEVSGKNCRLEIDYVFNHEKILRLTPTSENCEVVWSAEFQDFENTGNNNNYRFSRRFFVDAGRNNKFVYRTRDGILTSVGDNSLRTEGRVNTFLRSEMLGNLTISGGAGLTIASSDILGPFKTLASNIDHKKFTISAGAIHRGFIPSVETANGVDAYTAQAYVYIPAGSTGVNRVRLGFGDGNFVNLYQTDGAGIWHKVYALIKPANGFGVQWMIEAEGDVGDVFYIAFPGLGKGVLPSYVNRKVTDTANTLLETASFDSAFLRYSNTLV